jgi:hypothetical protein
MNDHLFQFSFGCGSLYNLLVNGVGRNQAVHHHRLRLPDAMATILCLLEE